MKGAVQIKFIVINPCCQLGLWIVHFVTNFVIWRTIMWAGLCFCHILHLSAITQTKSPSWTCFEKCVSYVWWAVTVLKEVSQNLFQSRLLYCVREERKPNERRQIGAIVFAQHWLANEERVWQLVCGSGNFFQKKVWGQTYQNFFFFFYKLQNNYLTMDI